MATLAEGLYPSPKSTNGYREKSIRFKLTTTESCFTFLSAPRIVLSSTNGALYPRSHEACGTTSFYNSYCIPRTI